MFGFYGGSASWPPAILFIEAVTSDAYIVVMFRSGNIHSIE
jgi:hypothetical protein